MKGNGTLKLDFEIKSIFHDMKSTGVGVDLKLTIFIEFLHPVYSHYSESLKASGQLKDVTFDKQVKTIVERENALRKKDPPQNSNVETLCLAQKYHKSHGENSKGDKRIRDHGRRNYRGGGGKNN